MKLLVPLCLALFVALSFYAVFFIVIDGFDGYSLCKEALRYQQFQYHPHRNPCM
ncbi:hypothetical protein MHN79_06870 [Vibrio sp. Of14-4]|uniref:hypothetical protein n=1 Tax=Vibrio sp. Of14-4 TaxID=2724878 RepID=UPI001EF313ED|nr:hypothetical protein [Vibrio sp. Of14-4]MCG7489207.1 hypothetical protein [Vibrio sp. Of14-4]